MKVPLQLSVAQVKAVGFKPTTPQHLRLLAPVPWKNAKVENRWKQIKKQSSAGRKYFHATKFRNWMSEQICRAEYGRQVIYFSRKEANYSGNGERKRNMKKLFEEKNCINIANPRIQFFFTIKRHSPLVRKSEIKLVSLKVFSSERFVLTQSKSFVHWKRSTAMLCDMTEVSNEHLESETFHSLPISQHLLHPKVRACFDSRMKNPSSFLTIKTPKLCRVGAVVWHVVF